MRDDNDQSRDVYAHYGLAMYLSQCLEHGLVIALLFAKLLPSERDRRKSDKKPFDLAKYERRFDLFMDRHFEETIGSLVKLLSKSVALPNNLEATLIEAKDTRNFLAHHYFRERANEFVSRIGRDQMIAELREAQQLFESTDDELRPLIAMLTDRAGMSSDALECFTAEYTAQALAAASAIDAAFGDDDDERAI